MPARGGVGTRELAPGSLLCFLCADPSNGGGGCAALVLRLLPVSKSGAGASPSPAFPPVMDIKLAAALIAGLLVDRQ